MDLSQSRSPIVIIIMSEFKVEVFIYALLRIIRIIIIIINNHNNDYKIFYSNTNCVTRYFIGSLGDLIQLQKQKNKTKPKKSHNPIIKM